MLSSWRLGESDEAELIELDWVMTYIMSNLNVIRQFKNKHYRGIVSSWLCVSKVFEVLRILGG